MHGGCAGRDLPSYLFRSPPPFLLFVVVTQAVSRTELQSFCDEDGHRLGFVPADAVVTPPDGASADAQAWLDSSRGASTTSTPATPSPPPPLSREERELRDRLNRLYDQ